MSQNVSKTICFDLDGVLCSQRKSDYENAVPFQDAIKKVNELYDSGHHIIIFTARFMGRTNNNPVHAYQLGYEFTRRQLESWGVKFHSLWLGKPQYDYLVDDRAFGFSPDWPKEFVEQITKNET